MGNLVNEFRSRFDFEKTVSMLMAEAERQSWNTPAVHDLQASLAKSGKTVKPVKVLEICKPAYSGQMLELNHERIISVMMPCRISVYQKDDGDTYIALINVEHLASDLPENIAGVMTEASDEVSAIIKVVTA
jgi:uncharacterized protein (DUF302 family)